MYYPRRAVDEQGRNVQFVKREPVRLVILAVLGAFLVLVGVVEAATGNMSNDDGPGVGIILIFLGFIPCFGAYYVHRRAKSWYYEDEYGFEMLTPLLYKKVAVSYNDIASWRIDENPRNGESALVVKTHDRKRFPCPYIPYVLSYS